jgi:predicted aminopeptidase
VGGVAAYATLGWFDDPLLNTMLDQSDEALAGLIFHELAHGLVYVPGDSTFNESFATFVEQEGQRRWLAFRRDDAGLERLKVRERRREQVLDLLRGLRRDLADLYAAAGDPGEKRRAKAAALDRARAAYAELRAGWDGPPWYDGVFGPELNNASLAALDTYGELVPAFAALLARCDGDLEVFYERVRSLAALDGPARADALAALLPGTGTGLSARPAGDRGPWDRAVPPSPGPAGHSGTGNGG